MQTHIDKMMPFLHCLCMLYGILCMLVYVHLGASCMAHDAMTDLERLDQEIDCIFLVRFRHNLFAKIV